MANSVSRYDIYKHVHLSSAWAAGRAASVKGCRFSVEQGRLILEAAGFTQEFAEPFQLPTAGDLDEAHRLWRKNVISTARKHDKTFTHGVAAKLINVYLKYRFVCGGHVLHERVRDLHPPIDAVLMDALSRENYGGFKKIWDKARKTRWSHFKSRHYEEMIVHIRKALGGKPMWEIEEFWKGNQ